MDSKVIDTGIHIVIDVDTGVRYGKCLRCGRALTAEASRTLGYGPACAAAMGLTYGRGPYGQALGSWCDLPLSEDLFEVGLVCKRADDGRPRTNVPHHCIEHSPDGFEFGYEGSGPADLALNLVEAFLQRAGWNGERQQCWNGACFQLAYALHESLKWDLIAPLDRCGGSVPAERIWQWLEDNAGDGVTVPWERGATA